MNLCDIKTVKQVMSAFHLTFRKEFGQNFLTDRSVVEDIASECCATDGGTILEIGPGIGTLTYELALRFMTDYLNGDTYFKIKYPEHNIVRTRAQIRLMQDVDSKLEEMSEIIARL